jgi:hypothetical protein
MSRLLIFLIVATLIQFFLLWALTHFGLILLGVCSWWIWSLFIGRRRA